MVRFPFPEQHQIQKKRAIEKRLPLSHSYIGIPEEGEIHKKSRMGKLTPKIVNGYGENIMGRETLLEIVSGIKKVTIPSGIKHI